MFNKKSRQVLRAENIKKRKNPILNISKGPNRHQRRKNIAMARIMPQIIKKMKISRNIKETKEKGRVIKQKHIDEVTKRTAKNKNG